MILHRAGRRRQLDGERHAAAVDAQILDEPERDDVLVQIGIFDDRQCGRAPPVSVTIAPVIMTLNRFRPVPGSGSGSVVQLRTTLTSTCVGGADGAETERANRSPSCTRGGTTSRTGWRPRASPLPSQRVARVRPDFAAPAARETHLANRHVERHRDAVERFARRQMQLGRQLAAMIPIGRRDEACAHAFDGGVQRRKIDRDLVVEPARSRARAASRARVSRRVRRHEGESSSSASTLVR